MNIRGLAGGVALAMAAAGVGAATTGAATASCKASGLVVWLDTQGDLRGGALGSAASRDGSTVRTVRVANGATARAVLRIVAAGNFPQSTCRRVAAAGLRVYPPNDTASKVIPFPFQACSRTGPAYLSVKAVTLAP
jgi:uncharacterized protein DUF4232